MYYIRIDGKAHTAALRGDETAQPIAVYDDMDNRILTCRRLEILDKDGAAVATLCLDPARQHGQAASVVLTADRLRCGPHGTLLAPGAVIV